jgi:hypothetical protein
MQENNQNISTEKYIQMLVANKNQADGKILAASKNQADGKILAASENQADGKILAGVKISASGEIPVSVEILAELEKQGARLLFRLESPTADFSLLQLMSTFSSSLMC